jgi:hypothetical protein
MQTDMKNLIAIILTCLIVLTACKTFEHQQDEKLKLKNEAKEILNTPNLK